MGSKRQTLTTAVLPKANELVHFSQSLNRALESTGAAPRFLRLFPVFKSTSEAFEAVAEQYTRLVELVVRLDEVAHPEAYTALQQQHTALQTRHQDLVRTTQKLILQQVSLHNEELGNALQKKFPDKPLVEVLQQQQTVLADLIQAITQSTNTAQVSKELLGCEEPLTAGQVWREQGYAKLSELSDAANFEMLRQILIAKDHAAAEELADLQTQLQNSLAKAKSSEETASQQEAQVNALNDQITERDADIKQLIAQCKLLKRSALEARSAQESQTVLKIACTELVSNMREELVLLSAEVGDTCTSTIQQIQGAFDQLQKYQNANAEAQAKLKREVARHKVTKSLLKAANRELSECQSRLNCIEREHDSLTDRLTEDTANSNNTINVLQSRLQQITEANQSLEGALMRTSEELSSKNSELQRLYTENTQLTASLEQDTASLKKYVQQWTASIRDRDLLLDLSDAQTPMACISCILAKLTEVYSAHCLNGPPHTQFVQLAQTNLWLHKQLRKQTGRSETEQKLRQELISLRTEWLVQVEECVSDLTDKLERAALQILQQNKTQDAWKHALLHVCEKAKVTPAATPGDTAQRVKEAFYKIHKAKKRLRHELRKVTEQQGKHLEAEQWLFQQSEPARLTAEDYASIVSQLEHKNELIDRLCSELDKSRGSHK